MFAFGFGNGIGFASPVALFMILITVCRGPGPGLSRVGPGARVAGDPIKIIENKVIELSYDKRGPVHDTKETK